MKKEVTVELMSIVNELARNGKGALFVASPKNLARNYSLLYPDLFKGKKVNILHEGSRKLILALAELDGAFIIDENGYIKAYGAKIKKTKVYFGHGTRHSAAKGISTLPDVMAILASEEDNMVRVFKKGDVVAQIDPKTGKNKNFLERLGELLIKPDIQVATSGGVASLLLGLNPLMAGAIFTGSWIITKYGLASIKDFMKTGQIVIKQELDEKQIPETKKRK